MRRLMVCLSIAALLSVGFAAPAFAGRGGSTPPPAPVELNSICQEARSLTWKASCANPRHVIVFDGVTEYPGYFVTAPSPDNPLKIRGYDGALVSDYPSNSDPVTLTGDNSVAACLAANGTIRAPYDADCVTAAVI